MKALSCDLLVAGSGVGGLTAALRGHAQGLEVVVAEKEPVFGGTSAYSAGMPWVPANPLASKNGDSLEKAITYLHAELGALFDRQKIEAYLTSCNEAIAFLEAATGVRFTAQPIWSDYHPHLPGAAVEFRGLLPGVFDGRRLGKRFSELRSPLRSMMLFGGMMIGREDFPHLFNMRRSARSAVYCARMFLRYLIDRTRYVRGTRLTNGNGLVAALAAAVFERNIPLWLSTPVVRLLIEDGAVTGAIVTRDDEEIVVRTRKAVFLACGGFPWNEPLKTRYYPHVGQAKGHVSAAPRANTGDGIRLARDAGGLFDDSAVNAAAWAPVSLLAQSKGEPTPFPHFIDRAKPGVIVVDRRGKRFANEAVSYHDFVPRMIEACTEDDQVEVFIVADHLAFRKYGLGAAPAAPAPYGRFIRSGYLMRGRSLEELANIAGIDSAGLKTTMDNFNSFAERGSDPEFGRGGDSYQRFNGDRNHKPNPCVGPIRKAPFYAVKMMPGDLGTFMGLRTDRFGRVLGSTHPIPGLYAVGNDAASIFAGHYPGPGSTIGPAITFAYIAAGHISRR